MLRQTVGKLYIHKLMFQLWAPCMLILYPNSMFQNVQTYQNCYQEKFYYTARYISCPVFILSYCIERNKSSRVYEKSMQLLKPCLMHVLHHNF